MFLQAQKLYLFREVERKEVESSRHSEILSFIKNSSVKGTKRWDVHNLMTTVFRAKIVLASFETCVRFSKVHQVN